MTDLAFPQRRIWFAESLAGVSSVYNIPMMFEVLGDVDRDALTAAMVDILERHAALRTLIRDADGAPSPHVLFTHEREPKVAFVRTTIQDEHSRVSADIQEPFDLSTELPVRCSLYERSGADRRSLLVFTFHHIVADDRSLRIFMRDFGEFYNSRIQGAPPALPVLKATYADFADWQMRPNASDRDSEYWRVQLAGMPDEIAIPRDRVRAATASHEGGWVDFELSASGSDALRALAKGTRATNFMVWHAASAALMYRLGAGTDVVLGTVASGRPAGTFRDVIGCFINTLALRVDLSGNPTFREVLARTRKVDFEALLHQHVPFERVVEAVNPSRVASRHPLVQVVLEYEKDEPTAFGLAGLEMDAVDAAAYAPASAKFDLAVVVRENASGRMSGGLLYSKNLFDVDTIEMMRDHLLSLVMGLVVQPDMPVRDMVLSSDRQVRDLLVLSEGVATSLGPHTVADQILRRCAEAPDAIAVNDGVQTVSYAALGERVNKMARSLMRRGIGVGDTVAIEMPRSVSLVVSTVAVLKAGAAYLHLDTDLPTDRRAAILGQAKPTAILTRESLEDESSSGDGVARDSPPPRAAVSPDETCHLSRPAYVVFTSGSTGIPKGVVGTHLGLVNFLSAMSRVADISPQDRVLSISGLSFDAIAREMFLPLMSGAALYFVPDYEPGNAKQVARAVVDFDISVVLAGTPSYLTQIGLELARQGSSLSLTVSAGESIRKISSQARQGLGRLVNMYGPTECTMTTTFHDATRDPGHGPDIVGRPLANCAVFILDESLNLVPRGAIGNVYISGFGVAHGYLSDPGQTAQKYIPCPFGPPGSRMYATGDLAGWRADGNLEFLGRRDSQLKVRGARVEASEVEMRLAQIPGIEEAFVCTVENALGDDVLVAYVGVGEGQLDANYCRERLSPFLPAGLIPGTIVNLPELPKLPNGKIDRSALPKPQLAATAESRPPVTELEVALCTILGDSLGLPMIGADDNFFELGGHSLLVAGVLARISDAYGVRLSYHDFFARPSVARLAPLVEEKVTETVLRLPESQLRALLEKASSNERD